MALHIIIDGYNVIHQLPRIAGGDIGNTDLQHCRESLVDNLSAYRKIRNHQITVVFDGWKGSNTYRETSEQVKGIKVIYTPMGVTADEVIKRLAREGRERAVIVTADRDIEGYAERQTATVITPAMFCAKVEEAKIAELKGEINSQEADRLESVSDGLKKKGPARRPPSRIRKNIRKVEKL